MAATRLAGEASATGMIANWVLTRLSRSQPYFMDDGDCEVVDQMRKVLTDNFSWRGQLSVRASCPLNATEVNDYRVEGEVLKPGLASVIHKSGG